MCLTNRERTDMNLIKLTNLNDRDVEDLVSQCPTLIREDNSVVLLESDWDALDNSGLESDYTWVIVKI